MFGAVAVGIFVLFFILMLTVKNKTALKFIVSSFLALFLGALTLAGLGAILTGVIEGIGGRISFGQIAAQLGGGLLLAVSGSVPLYIYFFAGPASARRLSVRQARYPDQPWMWVARWATGRFTYSGKGTVGFVWFVLLVMAAGASFVVYMNRAMVAARFAESPIEVVGFLLVFGGILLLGFVAAVRLLRGYLRWGDSLFVLTGPCGLAGGSLAGTIYTNMKEIPATGFQLELRCTVQDLRPRRSKYSSTSTEWPAWTGEARLQPNEVAMGERGIEIPVVFPIPPDARESDAWSPVEQIRWTLSATASVGGSMYLSQFEVPVFKPRTQQASSAAPQPADAGGAPL